MARESSRGSHRDEPETRSRRTSRDEPETRSSHRGGRDEPETRSRGRGREEESSGRGRSSGRASSYEYHARDAADVKKRASQGANDFDKILIDGVKMWKPNDGDNRIRILPPTWDNPSHYGLDIYVHYAVGPDRGTYLCNHKMKEEDCPICDERAIARRDEDEKYAKELEAKRRVLIYLIDRDHEKEGVQAWAMPWTVDRDIVKVSQDKATGEVLPLDSPEDGYDVEFEKKGTKDRTEYLGVAITRRSSELGDDRWLDHAMDNPLPGLLNYFDFDHINKVFNGSGAQKEKPRDRDDDERPSRGRDRDEPEPETRSRGRGRAEPEPSNDEPTWESVHAMTGQELDDLVDQEKLDINPAEAKDDEDLADWICEEMKLVKTEPKVARRSTGSKDEESTADRLKRMRSARD